MLCRKEQTKQLQIQQQLSNFMECLSCLKSIRVISFQVLGFILVFLISKKKYNKQKNLMFKIQTYMLITLLGSMSCSKPQKRITLLQLARLGLILGRMSLRQTLNNYKYLAVRLQRPATIHCVRAYGQMLKIFKQLNKSTISFHKPHLIMHSYGGSEQITKSMLKLQNLNIYFSLCLKRTGQLCSVIPIQRLVCQTDSPCQNSIQLLEQQTRVSFNKYLQKVRNQVQSEQSIKSLQNQQRLIKISQILKTKQTNQPINVISNIKSLVKYYGVDESSFIKIVYFNSLKAFKLIK